MTKKKEKTFLEQMHDCILEVESSICNLQSILGNELQRRVDEDPYHIVFELGCGEKAQYIFGSDMSKLAKHCADLMCGQVSLQQYLQELSDKENK